MEQGKIDLKKCETIKQMFVVIDKYYDIDKPLGIIAKTLILKYLDSGLKIAGIKERKI
jgi:hypothetical protein